MSNITEQEWRHRMGRRFEAFTEEAFHVIRWSLMVGLARYLSVTAEGRAYDVIHWALAALLFGYIASRLLLRPEIPLVPETAPPWQRLLQSAANFVICAGAFAILLWGINMLADGVSHYRFAPAEQ